MSADTGRLEGQAPAVAGARRGTVGPRVAAIAGTLGPHIVGWALPFALVLYLALRRGGYDVDVYSEVGIVVWGVVLIGAFAGILPSRRVSRSAWLVFGLLGAFTLWMTLSLAWTESTDRTFDELARLCTFLGVFALAVTTQGEDGLRRAMGGVAAAIVVVAVLALFSRFEPGWFPANDAANEVVRARLNYPLNYWNGLATLMAIGVPLLIAIAVDARRIVTQVLATAAIPLLGLVIYFTFSRGGIIATAIAVGVLLALHSRRVPALVFGSLGGAGAALLITAASQRREIADFIPEQIPNFPDDPYSFQQMAEEMVAAMGAVVVGVALLAAAAALAIRHGVGPRFSFPRVPWKGVVAAVAVIAVVGAVALDAPDRISNAWERFKSPDVVGAGGERFEAVSGNGRYQYWGSALDAFEAKPLTGVGAGGYEFWWDREGDLSSLIVDAHSLVFETAAELGLFGVALLVAAIGAVLAIGIRRALAARGVQRGLIAGAVAGCAAFAFAMAIDWGWELTVLPVAFLLLAAAILADGEPAERPTPGRRRRPVAWLVLAGVAIPALAILVLSLISARGVVESQEAYREGDFDAAATAARTAQDAQPWAAQPRLEEALALEGSGELDAAAAAAQEAVEREETNWENWITLSRIERKLDDEAAAAEAYDRARSLNPRSEVFAE